MKTEEAHRTGAAALGLIAGMLSTGRLQPLTLLAIAEDLRAVAGQLEDVSRDARG